MGCRKNFQTQHVLKKSLLLAPRPDPLCGVFSDNFGTQRIYDRYGFSIVGGCEFPVGEHRDLVFILKRTTGAQLYTRHTSDRLITHFSPHRYAIVTARVKPFT